MIHDVAETFYLLSGIYSLILIIIGTPANLICFYIFSRLVPNRNNPTIIVFSYLGLIEVIIPFTWNMNYAVREILWRFLSPQSFRTHGNLEQTSIIVCKLISYFAYFSLQCSAWLKTVAILARCILLHHQCKLRNRLNRADTAKQISLTIIILLLFINIPVFVFNGKRYPSNKNSSVNASQTYEVKCYASNFFSIYEIVHLMLYNCLPTTIMIICNILIARKVHESHNRLKCTKNRHISKRSLKRGLLTKSLVFINILFILLTAPSALFYIFIRHKFKYRNLLTMSLSNLATTSHVLSFVIYLITSTDFRDALSRTRHRKNSRKTFTPEKTTNSIQKCTSLKDANEVN
ncbi:unnamed protein product [Didymodactylos carnosus]|uniref:G-protein coupled receptors family 1 profile domain-containing protein n=1 Tax=Didymodactylos carnosus TaxID=1234261 RepID=A0A814S1L3_9BILA|nr:unnamed protein product [Didymodactylos carnosus]CAF1535415.1 unnamed protein product [Didymodactylos carnosus]CAF3905481.1 unnamed protein product [Didymodactylos carnosus]CAF4323027.1 unnamed protein product [Didymodactylos carnosus]